MDALSAIAGDYRWLPFRFDVASGRLSLVRTDRDAHRAATFLDDQLLKASPERQDVTLQALGPTLAQLAPNPCHFIFHSAFCCSTLLARALDVPGRAMGLKEPLVLNDLAQAALAAGAAGAVRAQLEPILTLLARPFGPGETVVIKPSNVVNPLIDPILELRPASKALLLSSELPDFLRSVAKKGLWGRIWARKTMSTLSRLPQLQSGFSEADRWEQSDLQVAALVWLDHRAQFARLLARLPAGRVASMDSADLLADPARALTATSEFFGLGLTPDAITAIAGGPVFTSNAKRHDQAFDASQRQEENAAIGDLLAEEIELVTQWAESVGDFAGVPKQLPRPMLG